MPLTREQLGILKAVAQFQGIDKYHGVLPRKQTFVYSDRDINELVGQGLLEWAAFSYVCGRDLTGLRLTDKGNGITELTGVQPVAGQEASDLAYEHLLILKDIYHFSQMPRYHHIMPSKMADIYHPEDIDDLLTRGYILSARVQVSGEKKVKGYIISPKGKRSLKKTGLI